MHPTVFCLLPTGGMKHATPRHTHTGHRSVEHAWHFPACFSFQILRASPPLNLFFFFFSSPILFSLLIFLDTREQRKYHGWWLDRWRVRIATGNEKVSRGGQIFLHSVYFFYSNIFDAASCYLARSWRWKTGVSIFFLSLFFSNGRILENKETRALCIPVFSFYLARNNSLFYSNISTRSSAILIKRAV